MATLIKTDTHTHYYDYGYSDWQCIECGTATDYCTAASAVKLSTEAGASEANRWTEARYRPRWNF